MAEPGQGLSCYNCGLSGHMFTACPEPSRDIPAGLEAARTQNQHGSNQRGGGTRGNGQRRGGLVITKYALPDSRPASTGFGPPPPAAQSYAQGTPFYPGPPHSAPPHPQPPFYPGQFHSYGAPGPSPPPVWDPRAHAGSYGPPPPYGGVPGPYPPPPGMPGPPGLPGSQDHGTPPSHHPPTISGLPPGVNLPPRPNFSTSHSPVPSFSYPMQPPPPGYDHHSYLPPGAPPLRVPSIVAANERPHNHRDRQFRDRGRDFSHSDRRHKHPQSQGGHGRNRFDKTQGDNRRGNRDYKGGYRNDAKQERSETLKSKPFEISPDKILGRAAPTASLVKTPQTPTADTKSPLEVKSEVKSEIKPEVKSEPSLPAKASPLSDAGGLEWIPPLPTPAEPTPGGPADDDSDDEFEFDLQAAFKEPETKHNPDPIGEPLPDTWMNDLIMLPPAYDATSIKSKYITANNLDDFSLPVSETKEWRWLRYHPTLIDPKHVNLSNLELFNEGRSQRGSRKDTVDGPTREARGSSRVKGHQDHRSQPDPTRKRRREEDPSTERRNASRNEPSYRPDNRQLGYQKRPRQQSPGRSDGANRAPFYPVMRAGPLHANDGAQDGPEPGEIDEYDAPYLPHGGGGWHRQDIRDPPDYRSPGRHRNSFSNSQRRPDRHEVYPNPYQISDREYSRSTFRSRDASRSGHQSNSRPASRGSRPASPGSRPVSRASSFGRGSHDSPLTPMEAELLGLVGGGSDDESGADSPPPAPKPTVPKPKRRQAVDAAYSRRW